MLLMVYFITGVAFFVQMEKVEEDDDGGGSRKRQMRVIEAVYFAVCTFSTVGYGIPAPISDAGKLFTVFFSLCGVGLISIAVAIGMAFLMDRRASLKLQEAVQFVASQPPTPRFSTRGVTITISDSPQHPRNVAGGCRRRRLVSKERKRTISHSRPRKAALARRDEG